jgi:hypothetical protein
MSTLWKVDKHQDPSSANHVEVTVTSTINAEEKYSFSMEVVDGEPYEPYCTAERWNRLNVGMKHKAGDIIIASYPKCGTTWMEQIVLLLINNGKMDKMNAAAKNTFQAKDNGAIGKIWVEASIEQDPIVQTRMGKQAIPVSWEEFANMPGANRVMKTHASPHCLLGTDRKGLATLQEDAKVILVTRNPFDACVSSYYYGFNAHKRGWPFEAWASLYHEGSLSMGNWFDWTREWYDQQKQYPGKSLWIAYEKLLQSPREEISRIIDFLQLPNVPRRDTVTSQAEYDAFLDSIIANSTFSSMKAQANEVNAKALEEAGGEKPVHIDHHLRKGECGDWKNYFNTSAEGEIYHQFVERFHRTLDGTGLCYDLTLPNAEKEKETLTATA